MSANRYMTYMLGIAFVTVLGMLASCTSEENLPQADSMLKVEAKVSGSRADGSGEVASDDKLNESSLKGGLQIFWFDENGKRVCYLDVNAEQGKQTLLSSGNWLQKLGLSAGKTYDVYAIANAPKAQVDACQTLSELQNLTLSDENIWKVHTEKEEKYFLMDQHIRWTPNDNSRQVISLDAMKRAAAKIQLDVDINVAGYQANEPKFRFENYNISTSLLEKGSEGQVSVREMEQYVGNSNNSKREDGLPWRYVAYSYAFSWAGDSVRRPSILVKMPMTKNGEQEPRDYYYRIPVCSAENTSLKRNHIYRIKAKITELGASSELKAETEANVKYSILAWKEDTVNVDVPDRKFLMVTPELVFMRNIAEDNSSVKFYASSACEVEIMEVYYYDKKNKKQLITHSNTAQYPTITLEGIKSGKVKITSPIPTNKTVKYIRFRIKLVGSSDYREVLAKQYPLEYAQNIVGKYSSRSTAGWVSDQRSGGTYRDFAYKSGWYTEYGYQAKIYQDGDIKYYYGGTSVGESSNNSNNLMYVIQITSTNGKYVIAHPKLKADGSSDDHVVSPAFMIASQLGAVKSGGFDANSAITHSRSYREVASDGTIYDNWRLPTNEEIDIIIEYQGKANSPIASVLTGAQYRTLSKETVATGIAGANSDNFVRCVRDLTPEEIKK